WERHHRSEADLRGAAMRKMARPPLTKLEPPLATPADTHAFPGGATAARIALRAADLRRARTWRGRGCRGPSGARNRGPRRLVARHACVRGVADRLRLLPR